MGHSLFPHLIRPTHPSVDLTQLFHQTNLNPPPRPASRQFITQNARLTHDMRKIAEFPIKIILTTKLNRDILPRMAKIAVSV
jgi:hypothetical protein